MNERYNSYQTVGGTRNYHRFDPLSENMIRCYITSNSAEYDKVSFIPLSFGIKDTVACVMTDMVVG